MGDNKCEDCVHFDLWEEKPDRGACLRYPPTPMNEKEAVYPVVMLGWTCGDFDSGLPV